MKRGAWLAAWLALVAAPAVAQSPQAAPPPAAPEPPPSPSDPIGDLLAKQAAALPDPEESGAAPEPPRGRTVRPVASPGLSGEGYDQRIRASIAAAQGYQGALDGGWTLSAADGELYALQLVDRGGGRAVEGAWRDLRKPGAPEASGFIDQVERTGAGITVRFGDHVATLRAGGDGRFAGDLAEGEAHRSVTMARRP